ncbi:SIR2 family protein [Paenibacillus typhae]|uniref:SIR2-like domain-containing protein n=1 Tax=Paenibacillus typhae TaxID=1174501 RepID=A0A1G8X3H0_9BACL|nr:SIR2 family protein [Paenibacillus typhae]SDJ85162.1 SIR2-like domain-containing protein [Paenibacillus typhae]
MELNTVFKLVQKFTQDVPLILMGTGGTIPYGIPGMFQLSEHLITQLGPKYSFDNEWVEFQERLKKGQDLESALTGLNLLEEIMYDITRSTWELVAKYDLQLFHKVLKDEITLSIGKLLKAMCVPHPKQVNVITTNYDRVIEYACDQFNLSVNTLCAGRYMRMIDIELAKGKRKVNLLKVHGSLDWFEHSNGSIYSIPLQAIIPEQMHPKIIPPGSEKYRSIAQPPCRDVIHIADDYIAKADSFLCIGYGFNDEQIQTNIISAIRKGKPIVVVTKKLSDSALKMISMNATNYVIIQENDIAGYTDFLMKDVKHSEKGEFWKLEEFYNILN